jgi:hypothetical protein
MQYSTVHAHGLLWLNNRPLAYGGVCAGVHVSVRARVPALVYVKGDPASVRQNLQLYMCCKFHTNEVLLYQPKG